jgi:hypothetical protein
MATPPNAPSAPPNPPRKGRIRARGPAATSTPSPSSQSPARRAPASRATSPALAQFSGHLQVTIDAVEAKADDPALSAAERADTLFIANRMRRLQQDLDVGRHAGSAAGPTSSPLRKIAGTTLVWIGLAVAVGFLVLRIWGTASGVLYGTRPTQYISAVVVAGVLVFTAGVLMRRQVKGVELGSLPEVLGLGGVIVSTLALIGVLLPAVPATSAEDVACPGARLRGVTSLGTAATSVVGGINARAEANLSSTQLARYPTGCTIGFDGFCVGRPVRDVTYAGLPVQRRDGRWLRIARSRTPVKHWLAHKLSGEPHSDQYIAAAVVQTRSFASLSDQRIECPAGRPDSGKATITISRMPDGTVRLQGRSEHSYDLQYAVVIPQATSGDKYRQITADAAQVGIWNARATAQSVPTSGAVVVVVAAPCIGPSIPPFDLGTMAITRVALNQNGRIQILSGAPGTEFDAEQAAKTACEAIE